jgi:hypothetical protein
MKHRVEAAAWLERHDAVTEVLRLWNSGAAKNSIILDLALDALAEAHLKLRNKQAESAAIAARFSSK